MTEALHRRAVGTWRAWLPPVDRFWPREPLPRGEIDMGNGRVLGAEDVLEGHFQRVAARRQPATRQVAVQVGDNLTVAIAVLAPDLAPLTEIAEQVSGAVPLVEPEARFREHLHQALERTHRQHAAQRTLGTRSVPRPKPSNPLGWWMALATLVATLALLWGWRARQSYA
ncbi:MAG: hypothetical protein IT328_17380 [Caldilineaceae bacterium]|nr:hypothetical protein [Caldilineaceae bacterium]